MNTLPLRCKFRSPALLPRGTSHVLPSLVTRCKAMELGGRRKRLQYTCTRRHALNEAIEYAQQQQQRQQQQRQQQQHLSQHSEGRGERHFEYHLTPSCVAKADGDVSDEGITAYHSVTTETPQ